MAQGPGQGGQRKGPPDGARQGGRGEQQRQPAIATPAHLVDAILGRPTATSIVLSVLCASETHAMVFYGTGPGQFSLRTEVKTIQKDQPQEIDLNGLRPDTRYSYQLRDASSGKVLVAGGFHTMRPSGSTFTFTVTADSHLDSNTDLSLYQRTLANAAADAPDFHIDLGDTFMTEKHENRENATTQYLGQRYFFGEIASSAPLFLTLGNHDGESPRAHVGRDMDLALWSNAMRKRYFSNPVPDNFYAGDSIRDPEAGLLQDYYAWQWGDAQFVVLSPYWYSGGRRNDDSWGLTLGKEQYDWLAKTLELSKAKYKFIFIHQLVGGIDSQGRGGAEAAAFGEWGGKNADGTDGFKEHRPGWEVPIHQLLVRHRVTIVFHGHDHLFATQHRDGIVYQEVPQPGDPRPGPPRSAEEYGYKEGVILGSSGHMRITVSASRVSAEYVRSVAERDERNGLRNRQVAYAYTIPAEGGPIPQAKNEVPQEPLPPVASKPQGAAEAAEDEPSRPQPRGDGRGGHENGQRRGRGDAGEMAMPADVAELQRFSIVLGRPTEKSVTANLLSAEAIDAFIEFGGASSVYSRKTETMRLAPGQPVEILLDRLSPGRQYFYRIRKRKPESGVFEADAEHSFFTQRPPGSTFVFEIQGDSHPERPQQFDPALYAQTLRAAAADQPDFYMTIGDDFSVDALHTVNAETVAQRYTLQRPFLALVAQSSPLFLVNGNHEQAAAANLDGTANNVAVWAQTARNTYFSEPAPDSFYSGDTTPVPFIGPLRDYYAWQWGDALFIVIDPYWHSLKPVDNVFGGGEKNRDWWDITLGLEQYNWLRQTLMASKAKYKFVFAHHVLGTGRGGIEEASLYEWGGKDKRGVSEFAQHRPSWELPIHQLMAKYGVTIFFQGHDHVFAHQQLDGVIYQALAEPADSTYTLYNRDAYRSGEVLPNSGRVRVTVSSKNVRVEYIRSYLPKDATASHPNGEVASSYEVLASAQRR